MRAGIYFTVSSIDRQRLSALIRDRNAPQKHVWRAEIILLSGDAVGTVTLELALAGVPMIGAYRAGPIEMWIALTLAKTSSVILANLVIGENVVPEFIQEDCAPDKLQCSRIRLPKRKRSRADLSRRTRSSPSTASSRRCSRNTRTWKGNVASAARSGVACGHRRTARPKGLDRSPRPLASLRLPQVSDFERAASRPNRRERECLCGFLSLEIAGRAIDESRCFCSSHRE